MKGPRYEGRLGVGDRCLLCGKTEGSAPDDDGFFCIFCGAPRVLVDAKIVRMGAEEPLLRQAQKLRARRALWGIAASISTVGFVVAALVVGVAALLTHLAGFVGELAVACVVGPLLFAAFSYAQVRRSSRGVRDALEEAEVIVVGEIARARGGPLGAADVAALLHVPDARAENLVARAQIEGFLASASTEPMLRMRVEEPTNEPDHDATGKKREHEIP